MLWLLLASVVLGRSSPKRVDGRGRQRIRLPASASERLGEWRSSAVLSIGKLATGQADYYLEQAHGSVTRARAVSSGVEDYYLGGPEPSGEWVGAGGAALGLR